MSALLHAHSVTSVNGEETQLLAPDVRIFALQQEIELLKESWKQEQEIQKDIVARYLGINSSKNVIIDVGRIKLKRYEFAIKEAVLFLEKPMEAYEQWINGLISNPRPSIQKISVATSKNVAAATLKNAEHANIKPLIQKNSKLNTENEKGDQISTEETASLECMRFALNFLLNAQKYVQAVDDGSISFNELAPLITSENESLALANVPKETEDEAPSRKNETTSTPVVSLYRPPIDADFGDESDVASARSSPISPSSSSQKCARCRELMLENDKVRDALRIQEADKTNLELKLAGELKLKKRLQNAKDIMDQEIEELTSTLFDQANHMVIEESRARDELNIKNKDLIKTVNSLKMRLETREATVVDLKKALYKFQGTKEETEHLPEHHRSNTAPLTTAAPRLSHESGFSGYTHTIVSGFDDFRSFVGADGILFREFQEFIRVMMESIHQLPALALAATMATAFIKRCVAEDVEPCLWYSYQITQSIAQPQSFKRKLLDLAIKCQIEVRLFTPEDPPSNEVVTPKPVLSSDASNKPSNEKSYAFKDKCLLCTIPRDCEYQIRLGNLDKLAVKTDWHQVCRFCRDRLTSTTDFFTFLSYIRLGLIGPGKSGGTLLSLFRQMNWLRRRMHLARVGSCSMFETEVSAVTGIGGGVESDRYITIVS